MSSFDNELMAENEEGGYIDRILTRSELLDERIQSCLSVDDQGRVFINPEIDRMHRVCKKLACGLFALRYGAGRLLDSFNVELVQHGMQDVPQALLAAMRNWPGIRWKRWTTVQPNTFSFLFSRGWLVEDPPLWCFIDIYGSIFAAVRCPSPPQGRLRIQLDSKPW